MAKLDLPVFLDLHRDFISIPTYTKEKHEKSKKLYRRLWRWDSIDLDVRGGSRTCKVSYVHTWTVFKVREDQLGKLIPYRNQWVLMYCMGKWGFNVGICVFPLRKGVGSLELVGKLEKEFPENFEVVEP